MFDLGTPQAAAFWGAGVAFIADAVVTSSSPWSPSPSRRRAPGPGVALTPKRMRSPKREAHEGGWFRSPVILGGGVLVTVVILNFVFG